MEISLAGIEQAVEGLGYRSDRSPKSRLIHTLRNHYVNSDAVEAISVLDSDALINLMWDLDGDKNAIKSKRKNLSSIKSSVNADLNAAWERGRNPEGINIGPLNTFVMSDAAKDKILNSFSGAMNLDGGNSLDRVTEALKIVSEYLSNLPGGLEDDKLSNLKSLVEGLAGKFKEGGPGEFEITEKREGVAEEVGVEEVIDKDTEEALEAPESDDPEIADLVDEDEILQEAGDEEEVLEDDTEIEEISEEVLEDDLEALESDDTEIVEVMDEDDALDYPDDVEFVDEDEILESVDDAEALIEGETEIEEIVEEDSGDFEEVIEEEGIAEDFDAEDHDVTEEVAGLEAELLDEDEILEDANLEGALIEDENALEEVSEEVIGDGPEALEDVVEIEETLEVDSDDIDAVGEGEVLEDEIDDLEALEPDDTEIVDVMDEGETLDESYDVELVDEDEVIEDVGDEEEVLEEEVLEEDTEVKEIEEADLDDVDEVLEADAAEFEEDDVVEVMDGEDFSELEDADILDDEDVLEEVDEADNWEAVDDTESDDDIRSDDVGLPLDQLSEEALNFENFKPDEEQKRLLAERFDGYLGAMERYYNQYILINKGKYTVGAEEIEADVLKEKKVAFPDYYMGKYPVTNALFEVFIERTGYKTTAEKIGFGYVYHGRFQKTVDPKTGLSRSVWNPSFTRIKVDGATWYQPTGPGSTLHKKRNHPVVQVSIKDARTFAAWTGKRLPTEIEWEAAARSQSGFIFPWGNDWREGCCNFEKSGISDTCPVDEHPQGINEAGLADLLGNVLEWTADECEPKYSLEKPTRFFIAKGGSWINNEQTHLFERTRFESEFTANILGFRCLAD